MATLTQVLGIKEITNATENYILYFRIFLKFYGERYKVCRKKGGRGRDHLAGSEQTLSVIVILFSHLDAYYEILYLQSDTSHLSWGVNTNKGAWDEA